MNLLELTLDTPAENLALDEALLEEAEQSERPVEVLRLWESPQPAVILGRSSEVDLEVNVDECARRGIPILRRCSGGATVMIGPGCLMYSVVLDYRHRPHLRMIEQVHAYVLERMQRSLERLVPGIAREGTSDLAVDGLKVSGNSLRCKRNSVLYHGTLLYDFPLDWIGSCLKMPPRQPDYRQGRPHQRFVTNLAVSAAQLRTALGEGWQALHRQAAWPEVRTRELVARVYSQEAWNFRR